MSDTKAELKAWINEINGASNSLQIFKMMDDFRVGNWNDEERSQIAKVYIAALSRMDVIEFPGGAKFDAETKIDSATKNEAPASDTAVATAGGGVANDEPSKEVGKSEEEMIDEEVWYEKM